MEKIYILCDKLSEELKNDKRVIDLTNKEKLMEENEEAMKLSYNKDIKESLYNDALRHYSKDSKEVKKAQKELFLAKKELESLPVVKDYLKAYKKVRELYGEINSILFSSLDNKGKKICE